MPTDELVLEIGGLVEQKDSNDRATIFKVPSEIRGQNSKAYDPVIVSTSPFHKHDHGLEYKEFYLRRFLELVNPEEYVNHMRGQIEKCTSFYSGLGYHYKNNIREVFTKIMIYNCCFVAEVVRNYGNKAEKGPIFSVPHRLHEVLHDMLLFENQLPFSVVEGVFGMVPEGHRDSKSFETMVIEIMNDNFRGFGFIKEPSQKPSAHLLEFVHKNWCPPHHGNALSTQKLLSATELRERVAVNFNKGRPDQKLFDITFEAGAFNIPTIWIDKKTEDLLRNMIVYERTALESDHPNEGIGNSGKISYVTHYMILMSWLINTTGDVKLLCDSGVINGMGMDHSAILRFFVAFGVHGYDYCPNFFYSRVAHKVSRHCDENKNVIVGKVKKWMVALQREVFYSPWAYISFFAALVLLVLTVLQTINSF